MMYYIPARLREVPSGTQSTHLSISLSHSLSYKYTVQCTYMNDRYSLFSHTQYTVSYNHWYSTHLQFSTVPQKAAT